MKFPCLIFIRLTWLNKQISFVSFNPIFTKETWNFTKFHDKFDWSQAFSTKQMIFEKKHEIFTKFHEKFECIKTFYICVINKLLQSDIFAKETWNFHQISWKFRKFHKLTSAKLTNDWIFNNFRFIIKIFTRKL